MLSVSATVPKASFDKCKDELLAKLAKIQEEVAIKTYNFIVDAVVDYAPGPNVGMPARTPVWSGAFAASWNIRSGSIDRSAEIAPSKGKMVKPIYAPSGKVVDLAHTNFKVPIYISNSVQTDKGEHYAGQIENVGTGQHLQPWKIAYNATQVARMWKSLPAWA